jgi:phage-related minor tail protein
LKEDVMRIISGDAIHLEEREAMEDLEKVIRTQYLIKKELKKTKANSEKQQVLRHMLEKADAKLKKYADCFFEGKDPKELFDAKELAKGCTLEVNTRTKYDTMKLKIWIDRGDDCFEEIYDGISGYAVANEKDLAEMIKKKLGRR